MQVEAWPVDVQGEAIHRIDNEYHRSHDEDPTLVSQVILRIIMMAIEAQDHVIRSRFSHLRRVFA